MKKILCLSKAHFDKLMAAKNVTPETPSQASEWAYISINDPEIDNVSTPYFAHSQTNVLVLRFADIEQDIDVEIDGQTVRVPAITSEQAAQIIAFAYAHSNRNMLIHCNAGVSRSGAVAAFLFGYFADATYSIQQFYADNPFIKPNKAVMKLLIGRYIAEKIWQR